MTSPNFCFYFWILKLIEKQKKLHLIQQSYLFISFLYFVSLFRFLSNCLNRNSFFEYMCWLPICGCALCLCRFPSVAQFVVLIFLVIYISPINHRQCKWIKLPQRDKKLKQNQKKKEIIHDFFLSPFLWLRNCF